MARLGKHNDVIGLDIGTTAIRVVQVTPGPKPGLVAFAQIPVPAGLLMSDSKADYERLSRLVVQLLKDQRISAKQVVTGLPSSKVFASVITTPKLDAAQLAKAIRYQAGEYIPMAVDQVKLDWSVLGPTADGNSQEVLLIAAPNSVVNKYLDIIEGAGLELVALEANAIASSRSLVSSTPNLAVVVLDIGSFDTDLTILYNDLPRLLRSVPVGDTVLVKSVAQALGLGDEQAKQFSYKFGMAQTKLEGQVAKAMKPGVDSLVNEIQKSIKFFTSRYPDVKLEKLVIAGDAVALPELPTYLANGTGLPVEIGNPWAKVGYPAAWQDNLSKIAYQFAVAAGLAERGGEE